MKRTSRLIGRALSLLLVLAVVFSLAAPAAFALPDTTAPQPAGTDGAQEATDSLLILGGHAAYMNGDGGGIFAPGRALSRAEAAQVLYRLLREKPAVAASRFTDVNPSSWYATAVNALAALGVVSGVGGGKFQPSRAVTRAEFVTMVCGCFTLPEGTGTFRDVPTTHWAYKNIAKAADAGWINGKGNGIFDPNGPILRCEVAVILNAALGRTNSPDYAADRGVQKFIDVPVTHWAYLAITEAAQPPAQPVDVPILMYHHFVEDPAEATTKDIMTRAQFSREMQLLAENGYTPVLIEDLIAFVEDGKPLPEKPVCLTIDDGYRSAYEIAYPILKRYGFKATLFPIGVSVGKSTYKDTGYPVIPHFTFAQAGEMARSGLVSIQNHSYDLHQTDFLESGGVIRATAVWDRQESFGQYYAAVCGDHQQFCQEMEPVTGQPVVALAYPHGSYDSLAESIFRALGVQATLAIRNAKAHLVPGDSESLYHLNRFYMTPGLTDGEFLAMLR